MPTNPETTTAPQTYPKITATDLSTYNSQGYLIQRSLFSSDEIDIMKREAERDLAGASILNKADRAGNPVNLAMWDRPQDDIYGMFSRNERVVKNVEAILGAEVYLYSAKMIMKNAREGGAWEWHQDFGYWYNNGCLAPDMMSIYVALDKATRENGCLQVLKGSHRLGRLNHIRENDQTNVELEHLQAALKRFELVYVEMEMGDALVFDGNLLHRSDANRTDTYRWGYICSYNAVENAPFKRAREYGNYEELRKAPAGSFANAQ